MITTYGLLGFACEGNNNNKASGAEKIERGLQKERREKGEREGKEGGAAIDTADERVHCIVQLHEKRQPHSSSKKPFSKGDSSVESAVRGGLQP